MDTIYSAYQANSINYPKRLIKFRNQKLSLRAESLATQPTEAEIEFYKMLKKFKLHKDVLFQSIIGNYIVDFFFPKKSLIVEIDGIVHEDRKEYDEERTKKLNQYKFKVLRFTNDRVFYQPSMIYYYLNKIFNIKKLRLKRNTH